MKTYLLTKHGHRLHIHKRGTDRQSLCGLQCESAARIPSRLAERWVSRHIINGYWAIDLPAICDNCSYSEKQAAVTS